MNKNIIAGHPSSIYYVANIDPPEHVTCSNIMLYPFMWYNYAKGMMYMYATEWERKSCDVGRTYAGNIVALLEIIGDYGTCPVKPQ